MALKSKNKSKIKTSPKTKTKSKAKPKARPKAAEKAKKGVKKVSTNQTRIHKRANLIKLYSEMCKMSKDAVDREVIKRFKVIIDTYEEDITKKSLLAILKDPGSIDAFSFKDILQPYIKHYLFLVKREKQK